MGSSCRYGSGSNPKPGGTLSAVALAVNENVQLVDHESVSGAPAVLLRDFAPARLLAS
jgi:hypothetical protein